MISFSWPASGVLREEMGSVRGKPVMFITGQSLSNLLHSLKKMDKWII